MKVYYNEIEPFAVQWLRNLIDSDLIAHGEVDDRDIQDIQPSELAGYSQHHFFAGIGGWSLALRLAGWEDTRAVWTGSCPCQPFSTAGKGAGFTDERHLWPAWFHLIRALRPPIVFGEQVEGAIRYGWLDLIQDDLEGEGYACGASVVPAAGVGAPHPRHRIFWLAESHEQQFNRSRNVREVGRTESPNLGILSRMAHHHHQGPQGWEPMRSGSGEQSSWENRVVNALGIPNGSGSFTRSQTTTDTRYRYSVEPTDWTRCDWIPCRDGKWRPIEPGTFPLAYGISARVGRLRGYGNAIVPQLAANVIKAYMECRP